MTKPLIKYQDVAIYQEEKLVLQRVNLSLVKGKMVYLVGEVGSGKSTLLQSMFCEIPIAKGDAAVLGYSLLSMNRRSESDLRRKLGVVYQDFKLLPDYTVYGNLRFVLEATGWKDNALIDQRINEVLDKVKLKEVSRAFPSELSGGEQQKIAIARALLNEPEVLLVDEPTGNLDFITSKEIFQLLQVIAKQGALVVMATHNLHFVYENKGEVYQLKDGTVQNITEKVCVK